MAGLDTHAESAMAPSAIIACTAFRIEFILCLPLIANGRRLRGGDARR